MDPGLAVVAALTLVAAACSGWLESSASTTADRVGGPDLSGQTVEVAATWTGAEQKNFEQVLALFEAADRRHGAVPVRRRRHRGVPRAEDRGRPATGRRDPAAARCGLQSFAATAT